MDAATVGLIGTLGGVALGALIQYATSSRQRQWQAEDDQRAHRRAAEAALAQERKEAYLNFLAAGRRAVRTGWLMWMAKTGAMRIVEEAKATDAVPPEAREFLGSAAFENYVQDMLIESQPEQDRLDPAGYDVHREMDNFRGALAELTFIADDGGWLGRGLAR